MKKGFTLTEMLGVLALLSIIALIAVPVVLDLIKDTKNRADEISINNYINAVNTALMNYSIENKGKGFESDSKLTRSYVRWGQKNNEIKYWPVDTKPELVNDFDVLYSSDYDRFLNYYRTDESGKNLYYGLELIKDSEGNPLNIEYDGTPVNCKYLYIEDNQVVASQSHCKLNKEYKEAIYEEYKIGDYVTLNYGYSWNYSFYVIEESSKNDSTVTLISAYPLYFEKDESTGEFINIKQSSEATATLFDDIEARKTDDDDCQSRYNNINRQEVCPFYNWDVTGPSTVKKIVDAYSETLKNNLSTYSKVDVEITGRLITLEEALQLIFFENDFSKRVSTALSYFSSKSGNLKNDFITSDYKYWTMTESEESIYKGLNFVVNEAGNTNPISSYWSKKITVYVRPVITISKNAIKY